MSFEQALRYLAPNLITGMNVVFGVLSMFAAVKGQYVDSAWWILYAVCTDRVDGLVARRLRGTSELGVQLDSLADFLNFGVAPAVLAYAALSQPTSLGFDHGSKRAFLVVACLVWVLGATFRLARFNVAAQTDEPPPKLKVFFGVPTTLAAGALMIWVLAAFKYAAPGSALYGGEFGGARLLDSNTPEALWRYLPFLLIAGGIAMASNLRMPKLGVMRSRALTVFVLSNVFAGVPLIFLRLYPELLAIQPTLWLSVFLIWGLASREARALRPPPIFGAK